MNWPLAALRALSLNEYDVLVQWLSAQQREQREQQSVELDYHDPQ